MHSKTTQISKPAMHSKTTQMSKPAMHSNIIKHIVIITQNKQFCIASTVYQTHNHQSCIFSTVSNTQPPTVKHTTTNCQTHNYQLSNAQLPIVKHITTNCQTHRLCTCALNTSTYLINASILASFSSSSLQQSQLPFQQRPPHVCPCFWMPD